jgi:hypothetical protein
MNERDKFVYNGAEFVYLTFGDWKWRIVKKHRESEFTHARYVGRRYKDAPEIIGNVWQYEVKHANVRYWERPLENMLEVALNFLETASPNTRIAIICDERQCLFWEALKLTVETREKMKEYEGLDSLIRTVTCGFDSIEWCGVGNPDCRRHCYYRVKGLHMPYSFVVPHMYCRYVVKSLRGAIYSWEAAMKEKDRIFDEMVAELMCDV